MKYKEDRAYLMESRNVFALRTLFPNQKQRPTEARNVLNHYLVHGKFSYLLNDNSFDMVIFSHVLLSTVQKLIAKFIGKVASAPSVTNTGLRLQ